MKRLLFMFALLLALPSIVSALPTDIVPLQDWSYDFLEHLAAKGALPGQTAREFTGERLYTRQEIAEFAALPVDDTRLTASESGLLRQLRIRFRQDSELLSATRLPAGKLEPKTEQLTLAGFLRGRFTVGPDSEHVADKIYRATLLSPVGTKGVVGFGFTDQAKETSLKPERITDLNKFFLQFNGSKGRLEIGRDARRWGPGYTGAMTLSDTAPNFDFLDGSWDFHVGRLGWFRFEQFMTTFDENSKRNYFMARRLEKEVNPRLNFSLIEGFMATSLPQAHLLVLPFYLYQHEIADNDRNFNYFAGANISIQPTRNTQLYGDLIIDDITGPFGFNQGRVERKIGYLVGGRVKDLFHNGRTDLRVEYAFTDTSHLGGTYWHYNPQVALFHDGLPVGHPIGPGARQIFARVDHQLSSRMTAIASFSVTDHRETDPPQINPTAPIPIERTTRGDLYLAYDLNRALALSLRVSPIRVENAAHVAGVTTDETPVEFAATVAF